MTKTDIWADVERVPADVLKPHPRNPRRGDIASVRSSLEQYGQFRPIVANSRGSRKRKGKRTGVIVAGHHVWRAALELGWPEVSVLWVDVDEATHQKMMLADNRTSDLGGYDDSELESILRDVLADTGSLEGTGYSEGDLARMFGRGSRAYDADPDEAPAVADLPATPHAERSGGCKPGQIWRLGPHRLAVGDSTDPALLRRLMGDDRADVLWTDPPYGVSYVGGTGMTIQNDGADGLEALLDGAFTAALSVLRPGAPCYIAHADTARMRFEGSLIKAGYIVRQNLVWVKNALVLGRSDYQYKHEPILTAEAPLEDELDGDEEPARHEPILYGFTPGGEGRLGRGGPHWFGGNKATTVFVVDKPRASHEHPTMKPTDLIVQQLRNSAPPGGLVLDLFGGSGSTMIAADSLGLSAALVELDTVYADVICARYERLTGVAAVLEEDSPTT